MKETAFKVQELEVDEVDEVEGERCEWQLEIELLTSDSYSYSCTSDSRSCWCQNIRLMSETRDLTLG